MTDEITETGYTEGSYGPFGIAVFYGVPGTRNNLAVKVRYRHGSRNCQLKTRASVVRRSQKEVGGKTSV